MAKKTISSKALDRNVAKQLEQALDQDLVLNEASGKAQTVASGAPDSAATLKELEVQISKAAEELARAGRGETTMAPAISEARAATASPQTENRPAEFSPANDDRLADRRSFTERYGKGGSRAPYLIAALLSLIWVFICYAVAVRTLPSEIWDATRVEEVLRDRSAVIMAALTLLPIMLFWAFAAMVRRAHDMRLAAQSMTELAFRLVEPEASAHGRVQTVGHAVRREVAALNEGIERTLARAVELETLVQTEVHQLERSYSDNEARIRRLVDGLGSEREAVVSHAERVRASIAGAHETLREELGAASDLIRQNILSASENLSNTIRDSGNQMIQRFNDNGADVFTQIDQKFGALSDRVGRKPLWWFSLVGLFLLVVPLYHLMGT